MLLGRDCGERAAGPGPLPWVDSSGGRDGGRYLRRVRSRRLFLGTVLVVAMAAATFAPIVFGVLASELISSLGIERWQVGMLVTASTLGGAFLSLWLGRGADMVGGRRAIIATLMVAGLSLLWIGIAPGFVFMSIAAFFAGIASASSNPATNKLISTEFASGSQGLIVGVKQSGVQIGVFLGGWLLPVFTIWWGWRWGGYTFRGGAAGYGGALFNGDDTR